MSNPENTKSKQVFRHWCTEMWFQHRDELMSLGEMQPQYDMKYYFNQYKWWLKNQYKSNQ